MSGCDVISLSDVLLHIPHSNLQTNSKSMSSQAMHYLKSLHLDGEGYEASRNSLQEEVSPRRLEQY